MSSSFRKIDYSIRPAKHAERRMLCEIFRRLNPFQAIEEYTYVGFGSLWFSDFVLFHRSLGIKKMISLEKSQAEGVENRLEANKPFGAIDIIMENSSMVLPGLDWSSPHFVWLDYDNPLDPNMLLDVGTIASRVVSGSILCVTVQCHRSPVVDEAESEGHGPNAMIRFRELFHPDRIPQDTSESDLMGWPFGKVSRTMLENEINSALATRNGQLHERKMMLFKKICDLEYEDGAKMTTVVGIFVEEHDKEKMDACGFDQLDFLPESSTRLRISIPKLTVREMRHLERQLPGELDDLAAIPVSEARHFANLYRYLPNFAVLEN